MSYKSGFGRQIFPQLLVKKVKNANFWTPLRNGPMVANNGESKRERMGQMKKKSLSFGDDVLFPRNLADGHGMKDGTTVVEPASKEEHLKFKRKSVISSDFSSG